MKLLPLLVVWLMLLPSNATALEMPPMDLCGEWSELKAPRLADWEIKSFDGWNMAFDGGSKGFFFMTRDGKRFTVPAANRAYWTEVDKKLNQQVFYLVYENRFYLLKPDSAPEKQLLEILETALPSLTGKGRKNSKLVEKLIETIKIRKAMFSKK